MRPEIGFLYKVGTLFYEGGVMNNLMNGKGRVKMLSRKIEYQGWLKSGKLDRNVKYPENGILILKQRGITLTGEW